MVNEFTKEELQSIASTIGSVRVYTDIPNWDEELLIKIESMIEKYHLDKDDCQHVADGRVYLTDPLQNKCIKCGELYR